jgi:hypothetical protein
VRAALICMLVAVVARTAHADRQQDAAAKAVANAGVALFEANDFVGAANKFREAYDLNRDPSYLFNVAQAYRLGGDCVRSADHYGRFLAAVPHPPNEAQIRVWYASELECAKERAANQPVEPLSQSSTRTTPSHEPSPAPPAPRSRRIGLALTLAATGVVGLGVGGFFAWDSVYLKDQRQAFLDRCSTQDRCSAAVVNDYDRRGSRANTIAIIGFAAGGAAFAAGAVIFVLSRPRADEVPPVAVTLTRDSAIVAHSFSW